MLGDINEAMKSFMPWAFVNIFEIGPYVSFFREDSKSKSSFPIYAFSEDFVSDFDCSFVSIGMSSYDSHKARAVRFVIIWKFVDNIEPSRIPWNREQNLLALNLLSRFCGHIISRQSPHPTWWDIKEKSRLVTSHKMMPAITFGSMQ
jgi:hypothetical protein